MSGLCSADVLIADGWITITNKVKTGNKGDFLARWDLLIDPSRRHGSMRHETIEVKSTEKFILGQQVFMMTFD